MDDYEITNYGDATICINFSKNFTDSAWKKSHGLAIRLRKQNYDWVFSIIPTYTTVLVHFDVVSIDIEKVIEIIKKNISFNNVNYFVEGVKKHFIPVVYGGEFGPDLVVIANQLKITEDEVINLHLKNLSRLLCFTSPAGQPLMDQSYIPDTITRLETPHTKIPEGTVAIVGNQTTVYTKESPGGWRLIGRTPIKLTTPELIPPSPFEAGDLVQFFQIYENEWDHYKEKKLEDMSQLQR